MAGANGVMVLSRVFLELPEDDSRVRVFQTGPDGILMTKETRIVELVGPKDLIQEAARKICTSPGRSW